MRFYTHLKTYFSPTEAINYLTVFQHVKHLRSRVVYGDGTYVYDGDVNVAHDGCTYVYDGITYGVLGCTYVYDDGYV